MWNVGLELLKSPFLRIGSEKQQKSWDSFLCGKWTNMDAGIAGGDSE